VAKVDLHRVIEENVTLGSTLYTDQWVGYRGLKGYKRKVVNHSAKQYVRGDVHTNSIESFWALFKRGYHGIYHQMSKKHLQRYINEYAFRLNRREESMQSIFSELIGRMSKGQNMSYQELIA
jgi:hypothetical protein